MICDSEVGHISCWDCPQVMWLVILIGTNKAESERSGSYRELVVQLARSSSPFRSVVFSPPRYHLGRFFSALLTLSHFLSAWDSGRARQLLRQSVVPQVLTYPSLWLRRSARKLAVNVGAALFLCAWTSASAPSTLRDTTLQRGARCQVEVN